MWSDCKSGVLFIVCMGTGVLLLSTRLIAVSCSISELSDHFFMQIDCSDQSSHRNRKKKKKRLFCNSLHGEEIISKRLLERRNEAPRTGDFNFLLVFLVYSDSIRLYFL